MVEQSPSRGYPDGARNPRPKPLRAPGTPMNSPIRAISSAVVFCTLGLLSHSCASGPKTDGMLEQPIRLIMTDFRTDTEMTLVNDAWLQVQGFPGTNASTRKAAFFSVTRGKSKTTTKVLDNRQAALLVNHIRTEFDFNEYAVAGPTPPGGRLFLLGGGNRSGRPIKTHRLQERLAAGSAQASQ